MGLVRITDATVEPVTLAEAKVALEHFDTEHDSYLTMLIKAARRTAEGYCGRSFITQTWRLTLDEFPCVMQLERGPVQSVTSIVYTDMAGASQTVTAPALPAYAIDLTGQLARIAPGFGYTWPQTLPQIGAVAVTYQCGYGATAASVPEEIKHWILVRVATAFENREEVSASRGSLSALPYVDCLLDEYRIVVA